METTEAPDSGCTRLTEIPAPYALWCARAVQLAYDAYEGTKVNPPVDWTGPNLVFTGYDSEFFTSPSIFGAVFQSHSDVPGHGPKLLVTFRGTMEMLDVIDDLWATSATFVDADGNAQPATVADGMFSIYSDPGPAGEASMQQQLMGLVKDVKPSQIVITGHSLGGALAQLFQLDLLTTRTPLPFGITHLNFASPRVGKADFASLFASRTPSPIVRVVNYRDFIPFLPPTTGLGYEHTGDYFYLDFLKDDWYSGAYVRHSMDNYQNVLGKAMDGNGQIYVGSCPGVDLGWEGTIVPATLWSNDPTNDPDTPSVAASTETFRFHLRRPDAANADDAGR